MLVSVVSVCVNLLLGCIYFMQLRQMQIATEASKQSVEFAWESLEFNSGQFDRAMHQTIDQTVASVSAADTAKEALHVSEGAFIAPGKPEFDFSAENMSLPLINSGHIPSGPVSMKVFEVSTYHADPSNPASTVIEKHWRSVRIKSIPVGSPYTYNISIPSLTAEKVNDGHEGVRVGGIISYGDGFLDTPQQEARFCFLSIFDFKSKRFAFALCDPDKDLTELIKIVGYPDNEEK